MSSSNIVFVLGNGYSRKDIPCSALQPYGLVIGCNAIFREDTPDILVAVDKGMIQEIQKSSWSGPLITPSPDITKPYRYSGYIALKEAVSHNPAKVYLLGFDYMGAKVAGSKRKKAVRGKNIYANTRNYQMPPPSDKLFVQRASIEKKFFADHACTTFIRVTNELSAPAKLGIQEMSKDKFLSLIKKGLL